MRKRWMEQGAAPPQAPARRGRLARSRRVPSPSPSPTWHASTVPTCLSGPSRGQGNWPTIPAEQRCCRPSLQTAGWREMDLLKPYARGEHDCVKMWIGSWGLTHQWRSYRLPARALTLEDNPSTGYLPQCPTFCQLYTKWLSRGGDSPRMLTDYGTRNCHARHSQSKQLGFI